MTFDGSTSSDTDGSIASYAWDFGDGGTGTGATPSRSYAAAGDHQVTLTVTDNDGATGSVTKTVTSVAPTGPFATDDFGRTSSGGWGSADSGGSWTNTGTGKHLLGRERGGPDCVADARCGSAGVPQLGQLGRTPT